MSTKVAIVTGAAGGMGKAFVRKLIADGCRVAGFDISQYGLDDLVLNSGQLS